MNIVSSVVSIASNVCISIKKKKKKKCNRHSRLLVNQQGLFYTVKKTKENCIVFTDVSTHKIISILFKNLSPALFLKFQPRYSYKYIIKKNCVCAKRPIRPALIRIM